MLKYMILKNALFHKNARISSSHIGAGEINPGT